jgi:hypothetical protein
MSVWIAVVFEGTADLQIATDLTDRTLLETIEWLDEDTLPNQRSWLGETDHGERLTWKGIKRLARDAGIRAHGHFDGQPGKPDAAAAPRAIMFVLQTFSDLQAIVLIRDQDEEPERKAGLEQARSQDQSRIPIVIGLAIVERECWVLSGFEPKDSVESSRLEAEKKTSASIPACGATI